MQYTTMDYKSRVFRAMNFISQNIERELSLEEIAETASFSMFHFHRIFKALVGETVAGFTRRLRLELAANRLLSKHHADITTIAIESGFSSSQNFAKAFHQHFGMTPSEYRTSKISTRNDKTIVLPENAAHESDRFMSLLNKECGKKVNAEVKEIPEIQVAYVRKVGPYTKETCEPAFVELMQWAYQRNYDGPGKVFAIYWDNPEVTPLEKCRFDTCIIAPDRTFPDGQVNVQTISGGPYVVCHFEIRPERIQQAWDDSFGWLCDSGYECNDTPCYEVYHNNAAEHPEGKWMMDICIPLKRSI